MQWTGLVLAFETDSHGILCNWPGLIYKQTRSWDLIECRHHKYLTHGHFGLCGSYLIRLLGMGMLISNKVISHTAIEPRALLYKLQHGQCPSLCFACINFCQTIIAEMEYFYQQPAIFPFQSNIRTQPCGCLTGHEKRSLAFPFVDAAADFNV